LALFSIRLSKAILKYDNICYINKFSKLLGAMLKVEAHEAIVVDCIAALEWQEPKPCELRKNLRTNMCELLKYGMFDGQGIKMIMNRCELLELHDDATVELDFRVNGVSYTEERYPFVMIVETNQRAQESDENKLYRASPCYDHMVTNLITNLDHQHKFVQMMRIYTISEKNKQDYKNLLRFVASCCLKARSLTQFVLPLLRAYEDDKNIWHLYSKPYFGTIASIMQSLAQLQTNSNAQQQQFSDREPDREDAIGSPLPQQYVLYFSACILQALQKLASHGISLNRMTTESVMVTHQQIPVLTDFLYANKCPIRSKHALKRRLLELPVQPDDVENDASGSVGILWPPPELLNGAVSEGDFGRVDVWNFGAFVLLMSVGTETFKHLRSLEHRAAVSQTGKVIALQPCNQMTANNRPCGLTACGPDLLHLVSIAMAESPSRRPTMRILQSASYYVKVNFLNLCEQVDAFDIDLNELLGLQPVLVEQPQQLQQQQPPPLQAQLQQQQQPNQQQQQQQQQLTTLKPPLQMLDQMSDVDELLNRIGAQGAMASEGGAP
ncbi:hypothetical protein BOX15_Mlig016199g1, partial [Macrostomum lignano]